MSGIVGQNLGRASGLVKSGGVGADAVSGSNIADDAVDAEHIADNAVGLVALASGTDGNIISYDGSGNPTAVATGNDGQVLTSSGAGAICAFEDAGGGGDNLPAFEASLSANSVGTDDTFQQLPCNTETFDVGGCYNNTGSTVTLNSISVPLYAFAPNVSGKYLITATVQGECGPGSLAEGQLVIKKDGTVIKQCRMVDNDGHARNTQTTYALVSMNGSSNYVQAFYKIDESGGGGWTMETGSPAGSGTTFGGFKIIE